MKSMTGFGLAGGEADGSYIIVEVRSVNHRFCEVSSRFPSRYASLESEIEKIIRDLFERGKFDIHFREERCDDDKEELLQAGRSYRTLKKIQRGLGIKGQVTLSDLLAFRSLQGSRSLGSATERNRRLCRKLVFDALSELKKMREREGRHLRTWFEKKVREMLQLLVVLERETRRDLKNSKHRLESRLKRKIPEERLAHELAVQSDRADVTEEIVRLKSHLKQFDRFLRSDGGVGRRLDFLTQEIVREINTIGSKAQGIRSSRLVVELKSETEKIREQVQNVE